MRHMLSTYLCVGLGLLAGVYVGVSILDYEPEYLGWVFGAGGGLSLGAFVAALVTNTPLVGSADQRTHRGVIRREYDSDDLDAIEEDLRAEHHRHGNGAGPRS